MVGDNAKKFFFFLAVLILVMTSNIKLFKIGAPFHAYNSVELSQRSTVKSNTHVFGEYLPLAEFQG